MLNYFYFNCYNNNKFLIFSNNINNYLPIYNYFYNNFLLNLYLNFFKIKLKNLKKFKFIKKIKYFFKKFKINFFLLFDFKYSFFLFRLLKSLNFYKFGFININIKFNFLNYFFFLNNCNFFLKNLFMFILVDIYLLTIKNKQFFFIKNFYKKFL